MDYIEEVPKYKKKSKAKSPKKADHKHIFEPCILEYNFPYGKLEEGKGFQPISQTRIDGYCPICGKVGPIDMERWWKTDKPLNSRNFGFQTEPTEEALRELNPETRTLPTFDVGDDWIFPKYVDIGETR